MARPRTLTGLPWRKNLDNPANTRHYQLSVTYAKAFEWFWRVRSWRVSLLGMEALCTINEVFDVETEYDLPCYRSRLIFQGGADDLEGTTWEAEISIGDAWVQSSGPLYSPYLSVDIEGVFEGDTGFLMRSFLLNPGEEPFTENYVPLFYTLDGEAGEGGLYPAEDVGIAAEFSMNPASYWPYALDDGSDPWWDAETGAPINSNPLLNAN